MAYNMFRLAAILQGIMGRVVEGTAANARARETGARARAIAEAGWRQVEALTRRRRDIGFFLKDQGDIAARSGFFLGARRGFVNRGRRKLRAWARILTRGRSPCSAAFRRGPRFRRWRWHSGLRPAPAVPPMPPGADGKDVKRRRPAESRRRDQRRRRSGDGGEPLPPAPRRSIAEGSRAARHGSPAIFMTLQDYRSAADAYRAAMALDAGQCRPSSRPRHWRCSSPATPRAR